MDRGSRRCDEASRENSKKKPKERQKGATEDKEEFQDSSVKWGLLTRPRSGFFKFLTTLKLLKTTKITVSQKTPFFKITKK